MKKITLICTLFLLGNCLLGQTKKQYENIALEKFEAGNYAAALTYYRILHEDIDSTNVVYLYNGAESARQLQNYDTALDYYYQIPDSLRTGYYMNTDLYIGLLEKARGNYLDAEVYFDQFAASTDNKTPSLIEQAKQERANLDVLSDMFMEAEEQSINQLSAPVNSVFTDFAPSMHNGQLYYSSVYENEATDAGPIVKVFKKSTGESITNLASFNSEEVDTHSAHAAFSHDGQRVYTTFCKAADRNKTFNCAIYKSELRADGNWTTPTKLGSNINFEGANTTQPSIAYNEASDSEYLLFASNRAGGFGGMDIWASPITNGTCGAAMHLDVNTAKDELTPAYKFGTLYFASEAYVNMGGFDLFKVPLTNSMAVAGAVENLGAPYNSGYDDMYYNFDEINGNAYFVSNRPGATCASPDGDCICNDIYVAPINVQLEALTFNGMTMEDLAGCKVELYNKTTGQLDTFTVNKDGNFSGFPLKLGQEYRLTADKPGWGFASTTFDTKGITNSTIIKKRLELRPLVRLEVLTFDKITGLPLGGTVVNLTDNIVSRDSLVNNLEQIHLAKYPIDFERIYSILGTKSGYLSDSDTVSTFGYTYTKTITKKLYLNRFSLPLTVYYDNDYPSPRSTAITTPKTYIETFDRYIQQRNLFIQKYSAGTSISEKASKTAAVNDFFDNKVQKGHDDLIQFSDVLLAYLAQGQSLEIILEGYASPIAKSDYNEYLTQRRIDCVINHFETYEGGILMQYLETGKLKITQAPNGEREAEEGIDDRYTNRKESVYNPKASKERRVRILDIRRQKSADWTSPETIRKFPTP